MTDPGASHRQLPGHLGDGRVRNAEEDDLRVVVAHRDAALAQAGGDGRTHAA
jgi:hypothetical protein